MGGPPRTLRAVESIGNIVDLLRSCHHNGFPVVNLRADDCPNPAAPAAASARPGNTPHTALPVDFEGPLRADGGVGGAQGGSNGFDDIACDSEPGQCHGHKGRGRLEGIILRSHLRHILGARFMRDGGTPNSLWKRVTSPPSAWPSSRANGVGSRGDVPLVGDPEMYELIEYRRRRIEVASVKEWEWGMFCEEDRSRLVNLASYMNGAAYSVHEGCTVARAYALFRSVTPAHLLLNFTRP